MEGPGRQVIVNEDDNRKLEVYTSGDVDASPSGIGVFACDPTSTMRILKTDNAGNLNVNIADKTEDSTSWRCGFAKVVANNVDNDYFTLKQTGSGQTVNQSAGSLVLTTGTTAYSETVIRSVIPFSKSIILKEATTLSQRIAQNNFFIELVDVIGDGLAMTINSATSVTVTIPSNPFTSANVGQYMYMGMISVGSCLGGRYVIASVAGNDVTFTVSGFPSSGTGTCSLFGWNHYHILYESTTATNAKFDAQRDGWNSGDTTATISTTASTHVGVISINKNVSAFLDQTNASGTGVELTQRASRVRNTPDDDTLLYLQIRSLNGSTNPAGTTTWTLGFIEVENFNASPVYIADVTPQSANMGLPVKVIAVSGTQTVTGGVAIDAAVSGSPVLAGGRASYATPSAMSADGDVQIAWLDRMGRVHITSKCATATKTNVASSATSVTILASSTSRLGATIYNDSTATLYLNLGSTASATDFTVKLNQDDYYEAPFGYTNIIYGIWDSATGYARVTEFTS